MKTLLILVFNTLNLCVCMAQETKVYQITISPKGKFCDESVRFIGVPVDSFMLTGTKDQLLIVLKKRLLQDMSSANMALNSESQHWTILLRDAFGKEVPIMPTPAVPGINFPNPDNFLQIYTKVKSRQQCKLTGELCIQSTKDELTASFTVECDGVGYTISTSGELKIKSDKVEVGLN